MKEWDEDYPYSPSDWEACLRVLEFLKEDPFNNPDNERLSGLLSKIVKKAKKQQRSDSFTAKKRRDIAKMKQADIAKNALENKTLYQDQVQAGEYRPLEIPKNCYACNQPYSRLHFFYHRMCPTCAEESYQWRFKNVDLSGKNVVITGGRVKIGFATGLRLLRAGAAVTVTSRFPALALEQYLKEADSEDWKGRLRVFGLDLRDFRQIGAFLQSIRGRFGHLDILINNAAQTIAYPNSYYQPLLAAEQSLSLKYLESPLLSPIELSKKEQKTPNRFLDIPTNRFGQPVDFRPQNSWNTPLEGIDLQELAEVTLINQIAPYLLIKELKPLLLASPSPQRFIINVTSSEGQFSYTNKTRHHPHTNMTKAALNMMTLTSAKAFAEEGIFMNAVDVGWVSTGAREELRQAQFDKAYIPPLDSVDGAARIFHPMITALEGNPIYGKLLKNFKVVDW